MPEAFRRLQAQLLRRPGGDREMVDILALVLQHDEGAVLCAVELALEGGQDQDVDIEPEHRGVVDRLRARGTGDRAGLLQEALQEG